MDSFYKYVIIGNGTAAIGGVEGIRSLDKDSEILIISKEPHKAYCRPLISYYLEGMASPERMGYRGDSFYEDNNCTLLLGRSAVGIDRKDKRVRLDDGTEVGFDKLLVAAGSSPFVPDFKGLSSVERKFSFMTIDDAMAIEKSIAPDSRVLIVGAGLIGLKCAEGLFGRVGSITVCDLADRVLSSILDSDCAKLMGERLEEKGIRLMLGDSVSSFDGRKALMNSGETVEFDVLVLAVGVRAETSLVKDAGGECGRGIRVDENMRTSLSDIYAAGDCTEYMDISSGSVKIMALMPNAYMQGHCAGVNMAGGDESFDNAIPMNSIGFFGLHAMSAGSCQGEARTVSNEDGVKKFYIKDGRLVGFMIIGSTARAGIYTNIIRNRVELEPNELEAVMENPSLYIFGREKRNSVLGGVV